MAREKCGLLVVALIVPVRAKCYPYNAQVCPWTKAKPCGACAM